MNTTVQGPPRGIAYGRSLSSDPVRSTDPPTSLGRFPRYPRNVACDLCEGQDFRLISSCDRHGNPLDTVLCERCGLVSHAEPPQPERLRKYYETVYRQQYHGQRAPRPHRVIRAWNAGRHYLELLRPYVPVGGHVCEVGAGLGANVKAFSDAGYRAWGIEPGCDYASYASDVLRADIRLGQLEDLPQDETLDTVLLIHVIEHLRSPRTAMNHIRGALRPGGLLYVECPDLSTPHSAPHRCFHKAHIYDFTQETLISLAHRCGFAVLQSFRSDGHVSLLLQRCDEGQLEIRAGAAARTIQGLHRFSRWGYYCRPAYWAKRVRRDITFLSHRLGAAWRLRRLVGRIQRDNETSHRCPEDRATDVRPARALVNRT